MKVKNQFLLAVLLLVFFGFSCAVYNPYDEILEDDRTPPSDYDPVFIRNINPTSRDTDISKAIISRIDTRDPEKLKFYIHVVDSNYDYLSGLTPDNFKSLWCGFRRNTNYQIYNDDYDVYEVKSKDIGNHAVALVMDHSGSMGNPRAMTVQNAAENFINRKMPNDLIALIKYDYRIKLEAPFSDDKNILLSQLQKNGLQGFGATTASSDAVYTAINQLKNVDDEYEKVVIVFTDGYDNSSKISIDSVIAFAVQNDIIICGIDFGYNVESNYLEKITSETGGIYHHIYGTHEFDFVFDDIYNKLYNYYVIEIPQPDFGEHIIEIDLCPPGQKITFDAFFNNMPHPGEITLLNVYFDTNSDKIKPESQPAINRVGALMTIDPAITIELRGHTDDKGKDEANLDLSKRRAKSVKEALVKYGIDASRISFQGFGESMPIAENTSEKGRSKNRRTEFIILK